MDSKQIPVKSKEMHNMNAFGYLCALIIPEEIPGDTPSEITNIINKIRYCRLSYYMDADYASMFSELFDTIENNYDYLVGNEHFYDFIISTYENDNLNLINTFNIFANDVSMVTPAAPEKHKRTSGFFRDPLVERTHNNSVYPSGEEHLDRRILTVIGSNFTPQNRTNLPFILQANQGEAMQLHFGTQVRRINNKVQIANTFKLYLEAKQARNPTHKHIYFNKLSLDYNKWQPQRKKESEFTQELHAYGETQENLYMLTMPADKGHMQEKAYLCTSDSIDITEVDVNILKVLAQRSSITEIKSKEISDFFLSNKVREELLAGEVSEAALYNNLIFNSKQALGLASKHKLSSAEQQALFFHTFMYELTNTIIIKLNPNSTNFSCKDAIDRGKAHYAYYNLIKSFQEGNTPWTFDEFNTAIHGTAAMVKARGMNHHHTILWNVIDVYVTNNYKDLLNDLNKCWLIEWRNYNCPSKRVYDLLTATIAKAEDELAEANKQFKDILKFVKEVRSSTPWCSNSLLTVLTTALALHNDDPNNEIGMQRRRLIIENIPQNNAFLVWLKGLLLILWGTIRCNAEIQKRGEDLRNGIPDYESLKASLGEQTSRATSIVSESTNESEEESNSSSYNSGIS